MNHHKMTLFSIPTFAAFVLGATVLGGCVVNNTPSPSGAAAGGDENPATGGGAGKGGGKEYFVSTVFPKLDNCEGCHGKGTGPQFLAGGAESAYSTISGNAHFFNANSPILTHGKHTGPALSADQETVVKEWLSREDFSGGGTGTGTGTSTPVGEEGGIPMGEIVQQFISCMDHDVWIKSKMPLFSTLQTTSFGACSGCHQLGNAGTFISYKEDVTFDSSRSEPFVYRYIIAHYDENSHIDGLVPSTRLIDKQNALKGFDSHDDRYQHPSYVLNLDESNAPIQFSGTILSRLDPKTHECTQPHAQN